MSHLTTNNQKWFVNYQASFSRQPDAQSTEIKLHVNVWPSLSVCEVSPSKEKGSRQWRGR